MEVLRHLKIPSEGLVLDLGSGHAPHPRSDVLCDRFLNDDTERLGPLVRESRPLVVGDAHRLPFRDQTFVYVIASHVLEHAENPALLLEELMRIAPAGYIETPTAFSEYLLGWPYHRYCLWQCGERLVLWRKNRISPFGSLFHSLAQSERWLKAFMARHPELFYVSLEWRGRIDYKVVEDFDWQTEACRILEQGQSRNRRWECVPVAAQCAWHKLLRALWRRREARAGHHRRRSLSCS